MKPPTLYVWTQALRSGRFTQDHNVVPGACTKKWGPGQPTEGIGWSAGGVLTATAGRTIVNPSGLHSEESMRWLTGVPQTCRPKLDAAGFPRTHGGNRINGATTDTLERWGLSFDQIADMFEFFGVVQ